MNHTKGPWRAKISEIKELMPHRILAEDEKCIALVLNPNDAKLIAASPTLLNAARVINEIPFDAQGYCLARSKVLLALHLLKMALQEIGD